VDLRLRGEGELIGTRQHGLFEFDPDLLERAHSHAEALIEEDPDLAAPVNALLVDAMRAAYGPEALDPLPA
jgi:RecG-like helicase